MASRDVELIIRAKDEATKVVTALDKAIEGFASTTKGADKISASAAAAFGQLASGFKQIDTAIRGITSIEKLQKNLAAAEQASERLRTETAETAAGIGKLENELQKANVKAVEYANKLNDAKKATADQKDAINATIAARKLDAASIAGSVAAYGKLETLQKNTGLSVDNLTEQLAKAEARFAEVSKQIEGVEKPTKRLQESFAGAGRAVDDYRTKLAQAVSEQTAVTQTLATQARAVEQQKQAYEQSEKVLAERRQTLRDLQAVEKAAAQESREKASIETGYSRSLKEQQAALAKRNAEIQQSIPALAELRAETQRGVEAQNQFAGQAQGGFIQALKQQQSTFDQLRQVYADTRTQLAALSSVIGQVGAPTQEMVAQQNALRVVLGNVSTAVKEEGAVLQAMRESYRNLGTDSASLAGTQKEFAANLRNSGKALADNAKAADSASAAAARTVAAQAQAQQAAGSEAERAAKAIAAQRLETELATKAQQDFAAQASGGFVAALRAQQSNVDKLKQVFAETRTALAELSATIGSVGVPTEAMITQQNTLRQVLATVATQVKEEAGVLAGLRDDFRNLGTDTNTIVASQKEFAAATANSSKALATSAAASEKARSAASGTVAVQRQIQAAYAGLAGAAENAAHANDDLSEAYKRQANASRTALSFAQRLRGEVLSLVSAYTGFYGVIQILGQTVTAYQTLEAATSRLNAVNNGDQVKVANDLDFVRRQADRLGIQFGVLADEYTKFAASTVGTIIQGQKTRDIFLSIAEAGRVNKLSLEDMSGIFKAVTQIASKGKFQLEELSGQLGDRLPGALQILADALGVTKEKLLDMTKNGEVFSEKLIDFAQQLDKRYGSALAASLGTTTTALGQLSNSANQALVAFGKGGFIAGFTDLVRKLNDTLKDPAFLTFVENISSGFGVVASALGTLVQNFRVTSAAITAFLGIKFAPKILSWAADLLSFGGGPMRAFNASLQETVKVVEVTGAVSARASIGVRAFDLALKGLQSATVIGIALTAISVGIELLGSRASLANKVLDDHSKIIDRLKNQYEAAKGGADQYTKAIENLSARQAQQALDQANRLLDQTRTNAVGGLQRFIDESNTFENQAFLGADAKAQIEQLQSLIDLFQRGQLSAKDFGTALEYLAKTGATEGIKSAAAATADLLDPVKDAENKSHEFQLALLAVTGTAEQQKAAIDELRGVTNDVSDAMKLAADSADNYKEALDGIKGMIPGLAAELKMLKDEAKLNAFVGSLGFNGITPETLGLIKQAQDEIAKNYKSALDDAGQKAFNAAKDSSITGNGDVLKTAQQFAGLREDRPGDNMVLQNFFKEANQNINPDITAWCAAFVNSVLATNGIKGTGSLAASSFANFGKETKSPKPGDIAVLDHHVGFFQGFNPDGTVNIISGNAGPTGKGSVKESNYQPKDILSFRETPTAGEQLDMTAKKAQIEKDELATLQEQAALATARGTAQEREVTIEQQLQALKREGKITSDKGLEQAREALGIAYDTAHAKKDAAAADKDANEKSRQTMANIMSLKAQSDALTAQLKAQLKTGDTSGLAETRTQLADINAELVKAIDNAIAMYEAIGGADAQAKIGTLTAMKTRLDAAEIAGDGVKKKGKEVEDQWTKVGELFLDGLVGAFDQFAQAVANGENVAEAARKAFLKFASDFLIEIGKMILKQALLNLLQGIFPGLGGAAGGAATGVAAVVHHSGGIANDNSRTRTVSPALFAGAPRFHTGQAGVGLQSGEVAAILKKREEVLSEDDPRNILNGGAAAGGSQTAGGKPGDVKVKVVNHFDPLAAMQEAMNSDDGERAVLNVIARNASTVKQSLG